MVATTFNPLTGTVTIPAAAPVELLDGGLDRFYAEPNNDAWGRMLCRVLYHESTHFWQLLASGYVANIVGDEWSRVEHYEADGEVAPPSKMTVDHFKRLEGDPFSAQELMECWARNWDVHTRSPVRIIEEEGIEVAVHAALTHMDEDLKVEAYTSLAFDTVMREGRDCESYAEPYRWMLERAGGNSAFVAVVFPALCHNAFGSPRPVRAFVEAFDRAWNDDWLRGEMGERKGSVNVEWFYYWGVLAEKVFRPVADELGLPNYTSGFDVIGRGALVDHPVYREYPALLGELMAQVMALLMQDVDKEDPFLGLEMKMASLGSGAVLGLPGQPSYRFLLGRYMRPPEVVFENGVSHHGLPGGGEATFVRLTKEVGKRVRRFRAAEKAVELGLPADHFEQ
jgi:hypothetical protein